MAKEKKEMVMDENALERILIRDRILDAERTVITIEVKDPEVAVKIFDLTCQYNSTCLTSLLFLPKRDG
jgi:hypothetical protein